MKSKLTPFLQFNSMSSWNPWWKLPVSVCPMVLKPSTVEHYILPACIPELLSITTTSFNKYSYIYNNLSYTFNHLLVWHIYFKVESFYLPKFTIWCWWWVCDSWRDGEGMLTFTLNPMGWPNVAKI